MRNAMDGDGGGSSRFFLVLACKFVPTPVEEGHRDCSVVTATLAMGNSSVSVSDPEIGITDASHGLDNLVQSKHPT